jgi:hypothetical protein
MKQERAPSIYIKSQNQLVIWTSITQKDILWRPGGGHQDDRCDSTGTWRPVSEGGMTVRVFIHSSYCTEIPQEKLKSIV